MSDGQSEALASGLIQSSDCCEGVRGSFRPRLPESDSEMREKAQFPPSPHPGSVTIKPEQVIAEREWLKHELRAVEVGGIDEIPAWRVRVAYDMLTGGP